jgi:ankyrin repeat protein
MNFYTASIEKIKELINNAGNVNQVEYDWPRQKIKELIENGADINRFYGSGMTPWYVASIHICNILLDNCPDMYAGDREYGVTPLWLASKYGYLDVVKYLIENGADIDQPNIHGATPLSGASEYGHLDVAKYLKKKGAK